MRKAYPLLIFCLAVCMMSHASSVKLPLHIAGNLLFVKAKADGLEGYFIIDTGAPQLVLNEKYYSGHHRPLDKGVYVSATGSEFTVQLARVPFEIGRFSIAKVKAQIVDLQHIERVKHMVIHGLIGYDILRRYETEIDIEAKEVTFHKIDKKGNRLLGLPVKAQATDTMNFALQSHFPYFRTRMNGKRVFLGLDTGAEAFILDNNRKTPLDALFTARKSGRVRGFSKARPVTTSGYIEALRIEGFDYGKMATHQMNLSSFSDAIGVVIDGILGHDFFKQHRFSLNFKQRKLYVWNASKSDNFVHLASFKNNITIRP